MSTLFICGAGNSEGVRLAMVCNEHKTRWEKMLVLDDDPELHGKNLIGVPIIGGFAALAKANPEKDQVINLVARTTAGRAGARRKIATYKVPFTALVHPGVDTFGSELADDVQVYHNTTIGPETRLGQGSVVFMGAVLGHGASAEKGCVMAANSVINARVQLGKRVYIGANSTVLPDLSVGDDATIAAGSSVIRDIDSGDTVIGVPADSLSSLAGSGHAQMVPPEISMSEEQLKDCITTIWRKLLGVESIEASANFFDLGGNSVLAIQMQDQLSKAIGTRLSTTAVFRFTSINAMLIHLLGNNDSRHSSGKNRAAARKMAMHRNQDRRKASSF